MATTIQISDNVKAVLDRMKVMPRESYNDVIEIILEDSLELSEKTKAEVEEARARIEAGDFVSQEEVERELGL